MYLSGRRALSDHPGSKSPSRTVSSTTVGCRCAITASATEHYKRRSPTVATRSGPLEITSSSATRSSSSCSLAWPPSLQAGSRRAQSPDKEGEDRRSERGDAHVEQAVLGTSGHVSINGRVRVTRYEMQPQGEHDKQYASTEGDHRKPLGNIRSPRSDLRGEYSRRTDVSCRRPPTPHRARRRAERGRDPRRARRLRTCRASAASPPRGLAILWKFCAPRRRVPG